MSDARLKVVIVGAGIAGLAAGIALRAFADVTILESASELKETGAAVTLGPGAVSILRRFGVEVDKEGGTKVRGGKVWSYDGTALGYSQFKSKELLGEDVITIHRVDLHSALLRVAKSEGRDGVPCEVLLGQRTAHLDADAGVVSLADGTSFHGDVIVAADGIRSAMRPFILGEDVVPQTTGESAYRTLLRLEDLQAVDCGLLEDGVIGPTIHVVKGPRRKIVAYPCRGEKMLNIAAMIPDSELREEVSATWTAKGSTEALLAAYDDFAPVWKNLLLTGRDVRVWQLRDLLPLKTWVKGRAILIGDAAHPMLPHKAGGALSAIEDAEALSAFLLDTAPDAVHAALQQVFRVRYKRASEIQAESRADGIDAPPRPQSEAQFVRMWSYGGARKWMEERPEMVLEV